MEETPVASGDEPVVSSGNEVVESKKEDHVSYETHRKLLSEKKRRDEELRSMREKMESFERAAKEREDAELKAKEDFKTMYERAQEELQQTRGQLNQTTETINTAKKYDAFFSKLGVQIPEKFWGNVPVDQISLEDSGKVDESSLDECVNHFRREYDDLVSLYSKRPESKLPSNAPRGLDHGGSLTDKTARDLAGILGKLV